MRAKNQTKSAVLMNLEQRIVSVEDIGRQVREYSEVPFRCSASDFAPVTVQVDGRQVLTYGQRHTAAHVSANIDKVCHQLALFSACLDERCNGVAVWCFGCCAVCVPSL